MSSANQDEDRHTQVNDPAILPTEPQCSTTPTRDPSAWLLHLQRWKKALIKFLSFIGPGFIIAVAYIDPGNYSTDIAAGASYRFKLLFIVLLSNLFAIFLQSLAIKLGTVSGLNLAEACRAFLPRWLNIILYIFAEIAIIATDIAEVIGFAIALNLLFPKVPLVAGCAISIADVMVILLFYNPDKSMRGLRIFEYFILCLVMGVVICFCIQLSLIQNTSVGEVFKGYLPSKSIVEQQGLYQACGILGATVMPHSLYLGSGIVQPRLREYDVKRGLVPPRPSPSTTGNQVSDKTYYIPSLEAIQSSLKTSIAELAIALFTFALFVNSAILIVAGASLYQNPDAVDADIFSIHDLLASSISPAAGILFALALLLSGITAGIVCTIAGQMVSEGALNVKMRPWLRRLMTRSISITPSIIIAGAVGRSGLNAALNGSQVALSIVLPFVTAPLIYFTSRNKFMTVRSGPARLHVEGQPTLMTGQRNDEEDVKMRNAWYTTAIAVVIWLIIAIMNVANLVLLGKGQ
ncbi:manganese transporter [Fusarium verticillioides 7600]|uniref:Manganese transporter n=1 Tax=Gibberella moniliformis (strain M3125 / FGSC 7600) TaxID=334819 RepID=W7MKV8_GIBM7|nr:manganese transporter [Fusarium verticillioides 7600]EWG51736.1 manganese transporter [Fusarium verticillioides 7600]